MGIADLNEIAKARVAAGSGGGGAGTQFNDSAPTVAINRSLTTTLAVSSYPVTTGSQSYMRSFNHGSGQFSVASQSFYSTGSTQTQFNVLPFLVNQTTGALTVGSVQNIWTNGSGNCNSTQDWGQAGPYVFNTGNHCGPGQGGNNPITTVYSVNNNSVSGTYNNHGVYQSVHNEESACTWNGSTAYWAPSVYNQNSSSHAWRYVWSYNGSSLSLQQNTNPSTNTSTNYTLPVAKQFGTQGPTGGIRCFQNTSSFGQFDALDSTLGVQTTVSQASIIGANENASTRGLGIELSNGRQLYYLSTGSIMLKNGSTLSDVTTTAGRIPSRLNKAFSQVTPVAANTWYGLSDLSPYELVKFSVDPTTYAVTVLGSVLLTSATKDVRESDGAFALGAFITGSTNQFIVTVSQSTSAPSVTIRVAQNPVG